MAQRAAGAPGLEPRAARTSPVSTDLARVQGVSSDCPKGHRFTVPFAAEAEIPVNWECRVCGAIAVTATGDLPEPKKVKPPRSHWDMLMERRSVADLEEVLAEAAAMVRTLAGGLALQPVGSGVFR